LELILRGSDTAFGAHDQEIPAQVLVLFFVHRHEVGHFPILSKIT